MNSISRTAASSLIVAIGFVASVMSGCSTIWDADYSEDKRPVHAATAGAVGAGLGAVVGHQTGNTGAGMLLGGAAGAASGYWASDALTVDVIEQERRLDRIEEQNRILAEQRRQVGELRDFDGGLREGARLSSPRSDFRQQRSGELQGVQSTPSGAVREYRIDDAHIESGEQLRRSFEPPRETVALVPAPRAPEPAAAPRANNFEQLEGQFFGSSRQGALEASSSERSVVGDERGVANVEARIPETAEATALVPTDPARDLSADAVDRAVVPTAERSAAHTASSGGTWQQRTPDMPTRGSATEASVAPPATEQLEAPRQAAASAPSPQPQQRRPSDDQLASLRWETEPDTRLSESVYCEQAMADLRRAERETESSQVLMLTNRALRYCPELPAVRFGAARHFRKLGRTQDAERELHSLLQDEPAHEAARAMLEELRRE